jgi:type I restriction enzyme, R subunit
MPPTSDTTEKGLEALIVRRLTGAPVPGTSGDGVTTVGAEATPYDQNYYVEGDPQDYDRDHAADLAKLTAFVQATQPKAATALDLANESPKRMQFLHRLQGEVAKRGVIDVLRHGVKHGPVLLDLFYGTPSPGNIKAEERFAANIFSVTRQLRYSKDETRLALDLCLFINGLPVATFELKNQLTKQNAADGEQQYKRDRDPRELLFQFGRCMVHFAVDDKEVRMCTHLRGKHSWFLPFNKGFNDGAGNPPNPDGLMTAYLWEETLSRSGLTDIIENYAQIVEEKPKKGRKTRSQIFPRYHQLDVVRKLLADAKANGVGKRYLVQHSAGSGKSNSIAWLAHQLGELDGKKSGGDDKKLFDSVVVVTDRKVLDKQIRDTIKQFAQVSSTVGHAEHSGDLRQFLKDGKRIIITTVQKFPFVLDEIGAEHGGRKFAIVIDEAHSSQGGRTAAKMNMALGSDGETEEEEESYEDQINRIIESRKMLTNASYFAFTATPKNKTLELFGEPAPQWDKIPHRPFHSYTMKQAIQEGFILDVLRNYTPVASYYRITQTAEEDPEFDVKKAEKRLRRYVESHHQAIRRKADVMVKHFHEQVIAKQKVNGKARAMIVCAGVRRAIAYFHAVNASLKERKSPYKPIVAFSGKREDGGKVVTEASINGFPSGKIEQEFRSDPYRFLIVANKFQTGYDEPLLHTMYVDKQLSGVMAVQTLSRLNRACPGKNSTFVLDFVNDADTIEQAFSTFYRTTILSGETDPNKLHDLQTALEAHQVYTEEQVEQLFKLFIDGAERDALDPILDACAMLYKTELNEDQQVEFKGKAKAFVRTYQFLAMVLPYNSIEWEKLSVFLNLLIHKLPTPKEEDPTKAIIDAVDMDGYRNEVKAVIEITPADEDAEIDPVPTGGGGHKGDPEMDKLSNIVKAFNDQFGNIDWQDADLIWKAIVEEVPQKVAADRKYQNAMKNNSRDVARIEHDRALKEAVVGMMSDYMELYKQYSGNPSFQRQMADTIFDMTYRAVTIGTQPQQAAP